MPPEIHALVQYSQDAHIRARTAIKDNMRPCPNLEVTGADIFAWVPSRGIVSNRFDDFADISHVQVRPVGAPVVDGVRSKSRLHRAWIGEKESGDPSAGFFLSAFHLARNEFVEIERRRTTFFSFIQGRSQVGQMRFPFFE